MITKKGAGGHQQPYIPAGNGEESGEYTSFDSSCLEPRIKMASEILGYNKVVKFIFENHKPPIKETKHCQKRMNERHITRIEIAEAINKPIYISGEKIDKNGKSSIIYYGPNATVCINPKNGNLITAYRTRKNIRNKIK